MNGKNEVAEDSSTRWTDSLSEGTIGLSNDQRNQYREQWVVRAVAPGEPFSTSGSPDGVNTANNKVFARTPSAPDEPIVRRSMRRMICLNGQVRWKATACSAGWTCTQKKYSVGSSNGTTFSSF
jgi:hypothetical protein